MSVKTVSTAVGAIAMAALAKSLLGKSPLVLDGSKVNDQEYDYVIIGGGTAGCVLAARFSEDPSVRVLLLEAGGSGKALMFTRIPSAYALLFRTEHVWQFYTEPQNAANEKACYWPRAKMLGGCSSINAQMAQRGSPADFTRWGEIIGDDAWKWDKFQKYFKKFEKYIPSPDFPDVDASQKGHDGPVRIGHNANVVKPSKDFVKACTNLGIPYNPDFNTSKGTMGVSSVLTYVDETRTRVSSESAYFTSEVLSRSNLTVVINATVTKVLTEKTGAEVQAVGVEFAQSKTGPRYRVKSKRDVIVSAGAIHSPQILLLSGIGSTAELKKHNIPVVKDLAGVGNHLVDHPVVDVFFKAKNPCTKYLNPRTISDHVKYIASTVQYLTTGKGAMSTNFVEGAAFVRSDDRKLFKKSEHPEELEDTTSSKDSPDLEVFCTPFAYKDHGAYMFEMDTFALHAVLLRPKSKGHLRLKSTDPWDAPLMDPKYLAERSDVQKLVRGLRLVFDIAKQEPLASELDHTEQSALLDHFTHDKSNEELEAVVRDRVETLYHPTSTCRMAPLAQGGVVDSHLRVYGVKGLRVCDASVYPEIPAGHTAGAAFATAEHFADILKAEMK